MADIAALGLAIDSSAAKAAAGDLDLVTKAAGSAEAAAKKLSAGTKTADDAYASLVAELQKNTAALTASTSAVARATAGMSTYAAAASKAGAASSTAAAAAAKAAANLNAAAGPAAKAAAGVNAYASSLERASRGFVGSSNQINHYAASLKQASAATNAYAVSLEKVEAAQGRTAGRRSGGAGGVGSAYLRREVLMQAPDIVQGVLGGQSLYQVALQQGGQVVQLLQQSEGGLSGGVKSLAADAAGLLTPIRLATAGVAGLGVAAAVAYAKWEGAQDELAASLNGLGKQTGLTLGGLQRLSDAGAQASGISRFSAMGLTATYAGAGLDPDLIQASLGMTKQLARAMGADLGGASEFLAKALQDPAKGVDLLSERFGMLDGRTRGLVATLTGQGATLQAQKVILATVSQDIAGAADRTWTWSKAWAAVQRAASDALAATGQAVQRVTDPTLEEQYRAAVAGSQGRGARGPRGGQALGAASPGTDAVNDLNENVRRQQQLAAEHARGSAAAAASAGADEAVRGVLPEIQSLRDLQNEAAKLRAQLATPGALGRMQESSIDATRALAALDEGAKSFLTTDQRIAGESSLAIRSIQARTVAEQEAIAADRVRLQLAGQKIDAIQKETQAQAAAAQVLEQATREAQDAIRDSRNRALLAGLPAYPSARGQINQAFQTDSEKAQGDPGLLAAAGIKRQNELAGLNAQSVAAPMREANMAVDAQIRMLRVQQSTFGGTTEAIAKATEAERLRTQFLEAGIKVDGDLSAQIDAEATRYGKAQAAAEQLATAQQKVAKAYGDIEGAASNAFDTIANDVVSGKSKNILADVAKGLASDGLRSSMDALKSSLFDQKNGLIGPALTGTLGKAFGVDKIALPTELGSKAISAGSVDVTGAVVNVGGTTIGGANGVGGLGVPGGGSFSDGMGGIGPLGKITRTDLPLAAHIQQSASNLGIDPRNLGTVMSYETGGTFDPNKVGPGGHIGLIQMGAAERAKYNWQPGQSLDQQFGAIEAYFKDRGLKPGMGMRDLYSTVNAGRPGLYSRSDAANGGAPGDIDDKIATMAPHAANADRLLGGLPNSLNQISQASASATPAVGQLGSGIGGLNNPINSAISGLNGLGNKLGSLGGGGGLNLPGLGGLFGTGGAGSGLNYSSSQILDIFADGGIMTNRGRVPLRTYSAGGIANSPQAALFGETSTPEAYVPVPSGKIPVSISVPRAPAMSSSGRGEPIRVNHTVINKGGDLDIQHETSHDGKGGLDITTFIDRKVSDRISKPGTKSSQALRQMGVRQSLVHG